MKQAFWFPLIVGLLTGSCIFLFLLGGLFGGFLTLFIDFKTGLMGGTGMIGFGIFLILCLVVVTAIYLTTYRKR
jgi:hypothetical protein